MRNLIVRAYRNLKCLNETSDVLIFEQDFFGSPLALVVDRLARYEKVSRPTDQTNKTEVEQTRVRRSEAMNQLT